MFPAQMFRPKCHDVLGILDEAIVQCTQITVPLPDEAAVEGLL